MPKKTRWTDYPQSLEPLPTPEAARTRVESRRPAAEAGESDPFEGWRRLARRTRVVVGVFLIIMIAVFARITAWQINAAPRANDSTEGASADRNRGRIVDRNGRLLVTDNFAWELYANPHEVRAAKDGALLSAQVAEIVGQSPATLQEKLAADTTLKTLVKGLNGDQRERIKALKQPGLFWTAPLRVRAYPQGALAAYLIGHANSMQEGLYGVEASYDAWLSRAKTWPGRLPGEAQPIPDAWRLYLPSISGRDLVLNLDAPLQHMAEKRLMEALAAYEAEAGTIIVMDPHTGAVLALANYPSYDLNQPGEDFELWVNPAVSQIFEPGSIFKLMTFAAALDMGEITPEKIYRDDGAIYVAGQRIRNAEGRSYGDVTARDALAHSLNVVTARICLDMGPGTFYRYVRQFGFGKLTEVDLNLESPGIVKEPGDENWSVFDQAANSFGQGISVSALQLINAVAAIANGGTLLQPQVAEGFIRDGQIQAIPPRVLGYPIKPATAKTLTQMMTYTVDRSAFPHPVPGYRVAGKTGTAEIPTETGYTSQDTLASFVGFFPAADPQVVILVKLVKPKKSIWAEQVAVPVFGQVGQDAARILRIQLDEREP